MNRINILVTGSGGGVGHGIIKCLKDITDLEINIVAADMSPLSAGLYHGNKQYIVPNVNSDSYFEEVGKIFDKEKINYYIPGTDIELEICSKNKNFLFEKWGVKTIVSSIDTIQIANSKYKTANFLKLNNLNYPKTDYLEDHKIGSFDYPLILKPDIGYRSIGVEKIENPIDLKKAKSSREGYVVQEFIEGPEYTCTVVKNNSDISKVIIFKRDLRFGDTYRAYPMAKDNISSYVRSIADLLDIEGGCNFQLREDKDGNPKLFEINSRFSGTTPFCSLIGFNPLEYYLKNELQKAYNYKIDYDSIILRHWQEIKVEKTKIKALD